MAAYTNHPPRERYVKSNSSFRKAAISHLIPTCMTEVLSLPVLFMNEEQGSERLKVTYHVVF